MPIRLGGSQQLFLNSGVPQGSVHMSVLLSMFIDKGVKQKYLLIFVNCQI